MKKRRRLRKSIRLALKFTGYVAAAMLADLMAMGAILYYFGDLYILSALGVCLVINGVTEYLFFKDEFRRRAKV